jgi:hypothetical protein
VKTVPPVDTVGDALVAAGGVFAGGVIAGGVFAWDVVAVVGPGAGDGEEVTVAVGVAEACVADGVALGVTMVEADDDGSSVAFVSSLLTASWVSSWPEPPVIPWPSSETASRLPAAAVAAPSSQATAPKRMRLCMLKHRTPGAKGTLSPA